MSIVIIFFAIFNIVFAGKVYPGVRLGKINLSGKTQEQAKDLINNNIASFRYNNLELTHNDQKFTLDSQKLNINFNEDDLVKRAMVQGRDSSFFKNLINQANLLIIGKNLNISYDLDKKQLEAEVANIAKSVNKDVKEPGLEVKDGRVYFIDSQKGQKLNEGQIQIEIKNRLSNLSLNPVSIQVAEVIPKIKAKNVEQTQKEVEEILSEPISFKYEDRKWQLGSVEIGSWLKFTPSEVKGLSSNWVKIPEISKVNYDLEDYSAGLLFLDNFDFYKRLILKPEIDEQKTRDFLNSFANKEINIKPKNATLAFQNGKVVVTASEQDGYQMEVDRTLNDISDALFGNSEDNRQINLELILEKADVRSDNYLALGIKDLIGNGTSNFAGSPTNRIHNIQVGAAAVNGALVKPGDSFSLDQTLGSIGPETGYLPELVIKENKTVPEYGGGLCQVGTTCFRAALNSSLPILERQNHAYIVQYYAPTGTDATIYPPHPDVLFKNDTSNYILIQTTVSDNILTFDFYGTKSNRTSKFNGLDNPDGAVDRIEDVNPHVYNQQADGSAEAEFYRLIYENNQLVKSERFYSKYDSPSKYPH